MNELYEKRLNDYKPVVNGLTEDELSQAIWKKFV